jgi:hypothetical protein
MEPRVVRRMLIGLIVFGAAVIVPVASASQVVSTSTVSGLKLGVNDKGEALLTYTSRGKLVHVLATGAVNALPPVQGGKQVASSLDYSGGYKASSGTTATSYWSSFTCPAYNGPPLAWMTTACKAPDGSYWAVQEWQRQLPDYGVAPNPVQAASEVHLSHWTGPLPVLTITMNWAYKKYDHLFGTFTYNGSGVYGFASTPGGSPLDSWGRNVYVDTLDSAYGTGWRRDNSFLTHKAGGSFCYGFYAHGAFPAGNGTKYRATIIGPGLEPDIMWQGNAPGSYDPTAQAAADKAIVALNDPQCKPV